MKNPRKRTFHFYADSGHGWLKVPLKLIRELGVQNKISTFSYQKGDFGYLEEDADAHVFLQALKDAGVEGKIVPHSGSKRSRIRNYPRFQTTWRSSLEGHPQYYSGRKKNPRKPKFPSNANLSTLVSHLKKELRKYPNEYIDLSAPTEQYGEPAIQLTVGADGKAYDDWGYQTGDNSYTGGAYGYQNWAIVYVTLDETIKDTVDDIKSQLWEQWY